MAKSIEPGWPSRCDSIRRFYVFWTAALRGSSDAHSGVVRQSRLALGGVHHGRDAPPPVSRVIKYSATFTSPRDLDPHWFRRLAMGNSMGIRQKRGTRRLAVLCCDHGKSASACRDQIFYGRVARERVWFSWNFLHHVSGLGCRNLLER